jgi:hypothetical protein
MDDETNNISKSLCRIVLIDGCLDFVDTRAISAISMPDVSNN